MSQNTNGKVSEKKPDTEVVEKAKRRQYTAEYKLRIQLKCWNEKQNAVCIA